MGNKQLIGEEAYEFDFLNEKNKLGQGSFA